MTEPLPLISIIAPAFNEEESAEPFHTAVTRVITGLEDRYRFEFVFVDDGSSDNTFSVLKALAARDKRVRVIRFSRNFGFQQAVFTGFCKARGDAAIELDCDLQDPPELIGEFARLWKEENWQVVYGVRRKRQESALMTKMRHLAYWIINRLSEDPIPLDTAISGWWTGGCWTNCGECRTSSPICAGPSPPWDFGRSACPTTVRLARWARASFRSPN